ncbi:hypothetical protein LOD99_375 [Oopsacas minuta]|uniref:Uncharacterized protein n=1 Tax=Oopsacas minuta TaxID=111878 RepID=A0AAV7K8S1_9METZ|nr:hypothetical protein LOD99_375 [Oopsacas minuta]
MSGRRVRFGENPDLFPLSSEIYSRGQQPSSPVYVMPMISPDKWDKAIDEKKKKGSSKNKQQKKRKDSDDSDDSDSDEDDESKKKKSKGKGTGDQGKGKGKGVKKSPFNNLTTWQIVLGAVLILMSIMALGQLKHANQQVLLHQKRLQNLESQIDHLQKQSDWRDDLNTKLRYKIHTLQMEKYNLEQLTEAPVTVQVANGIGTAFHWLASSIVNAGSGLLGNIGDAMGSVGDSSRNLISYSPPYGSSYDDEDLYDEPPNYKPPRYFRNN